MLWGFARQQYAPGKTRGLPGHHLIHGVRGHGQRAHEIFELGLTVLHAEETEGERPRQAAQRQIAGQRADNRGRASQPLGHARQIVLRLKQQAVFREKRIAIQVPHRMKQLGPLGQPLRQAGGGLGHKLRRRRIDHHQDRTERTGECLLEADLTLPPAEFGRNQLVDVGRDGEVARGIKARAGGDDGRHDDDRPSMTAAQPNDLPDDGN